MVQIEPSKRLRHFPLRSPVSIFAIFLMATTLPGQPFTIDTIQWTGSPDARINIVFFGDGYQVNEFEKYAEDVDQES